ncbi:MAG: hypothetical protein ATN36_07350 [Epulopiscium sp. Nele67-Bin005]|nr:MAG: hypothetical protein ATN36_07350 [Epulopiscium sp. Nele67-Bin005]
MKKSILRLGIAIIIFKVLVMSINLFIENMAFFLQDQYNISIDENLHIYLTLFSCTSFFIGFPVYTFLMRYKNEKPLPTERAKVSTQYLIIRLLVILSIWAILAVLLPPADVMSFRSIVDTLVFTVILYPIMEEVMWRELLFPEFGELGKNKFVAITTIGWAFLMHNMPINMMIALVAGFLLLGPLYYKTQNIKLCIFFHSFINLFFGLILSNTKLFFGYQLFGISTMMIIAIIIWVATIAYYFTTRNKPVAE